MRDQMTKNVNRNASFDSLKSESGGSVDTSPDSLGNSFQFHKLNSITNDKILCSQRKLRKGETNRKLTLCEDDY